MSAPCDKVHLGDGAYCSFDGYALVLTAENGIEATDRVFLEPEVFAAFVRYADRAMPGVLEAIGLAPRIAQPAVQRPMSTLAATALRTVFEDADGLLAPSVADGTLHKGTTLAVFGALRDAVRPFNAALAEELIAVETEKAEVRG